VSDKRHDNVVNINDLERMERLAGDRWGARYSQVARKAGSEQLGCGYFEVAPGRAAMPRHWHGAAEEALYILEGTGTLHIGDNTVTVRSGDWVALPVGPDHAHRLDNTSDAPLKYLALSTRQTTDVVGYPDSGKIGAFTGAATDGPMDAGWVRKWFPEDAAVGYFHGDDMD